MWAPGGLQLLGSCRGIVVMGELWKKRGVPDPACAQPLPALLTASSAVPLARCCPAFCVTALTDVLRKGMGITVWSHLPDAFPVLELAGMAGDL